ncbi:MAG: type II toxin-antitoxin system HicB family antitoxin [Gammaproteobacteria bacterium]
MRIEKVKTTNGTFTAVFEKSGNWHIVHVKEVPGALSQEKTMREARQSIVEAIDLVIEVDRELEAERDAKKTAHEHVAVAAS